MSTATAGRERFFAAARAHTVDEHDHALWEALVDQAQGGKGIRPLVLNRVYASLGGQRPEVAELVGGAVELLHTAFVIHDDVIDDDDHRRGRPNVRGTFAARAAATGAEPDSARRYGDAASILAGDLALGGAVREMALCGAPHEIVVRLLDLLEEVLHRSAAGELADVRVSMTGDASVAGALDIAEWKTAAYSFQLPLQAAAILAEVDEDVVTSLGRVGRAMGIAYQLRDDLRGVFDTREVAGKDPLGDLREGKSTVLIEVARPSRQWDELAAYVGNPHLDEHGAARARELLIASGARRTVEGLVAEQRGAALVAALDLPPGTVEEVVALVDLFVPGGDEGHPVRQDGGTDASSRHDGAKGAAR